MMYRVNCCAYRIHLAADRTDLLVDMTDCSKSECCEFPFACESVDAAREHAGSSYMSIGRYR